MPSSLQMQLSKRDLEKAFKASLIILDADTVTTGRQEKIKALAGVIAEDFDVQELSQALIIVSAMMFRDEGVEHFRQMVGDVPFWA